MNSYNSTTRANPNLSEMMIEISKTLDNIKTQRLSLDREIENDEIYKEKLIEQLKKFQNEHARVGGILFICNLNVIIHLESIDDKSALLEVYNKILKESDEAYTKVSRYNSILFYIK